MRILITTDVAGGVWSYTEELVEALLDRGHTVGLVIVGSKPGAMHRRWLADHPELHVSALPVPLEWVPEPEPALSASVDSLRRIAVRFDPDVIHLNQFFYGAYDLGAPRVVVAHSDVVTWWQEVKRAEPPNDAWFRRYRRWVASGLQEAHVRVAPTHWLASRMEAVYECAPVRVVYNARSPERFRSRRRAVRESLVVTAGRLWDEAKGARDLIPAARLVARRGRVVVAGPAEHPTGGEDFPTDAPGVEWAGVLDAQELRLLLAQAQVYAATSRYEPFGLAPVEAALAGCALVMSDIPTYRELWDDCALFYPPGDSDALAAAALELLVDEERRASLAEAARERAIERYTPARMVAEYEAIYHDAIQRVAREPVVAD